ncbi:ribosome-inactivating family protein [Streptomyces sp. 2P-4]|uniref:ribosome-inactivating family protein n=1 Tax=Streptomyces sp. 2P-4 TaxID=2931974 RepID=UPI002540695D|nr:ribosome-inactivating family protein [Streptomyces sp. 2P-4]
MQLISAARNTGRRLGVLLLALLATCSLVNINATPAHADTSNRWTTMEWDITELAWGTADEDAGRMYRRMIDEFRGHAAHRIGDVQELMPTRQTAQYLELRVINRNDSPTHRLSLYFRLDTLYLEGFTTNGQNFRFSEPSTTLVTEFRNHYRQGNLLFTNLPYTGSYLDLANDSVRGAAPFQAHNVMSYINSMIATTEHNMDDTTRRRAIANVIAMTSEAIRIGWIERRIDHTISFGEAYDGQAHQTTLGGFGVSLENNWRRLSILAHRDIAGTRRPQDAVNIGGTLYQTLNHILGGAPSDTPQRIAPLIMKYDAR